MRNSYILYLNTYNRLEVENGSTKQSFISKILDKILAIVEIFILDSIRKIRTQITKYQLYMQNYII